MNALTEYATESILLVFLIITFLQSGLDKLLDWKGNLTWLSGCLLYTSDAADESSSV